MTNSILVLGLGITAEGVINFCKLRSIPYYIHDDFREPLHNKFNGDFSNISLVIKSPGMPNDNGMLVKARDAKIDIISDIEYFFRNKPANLKILGVTGSNGKSTTTTLIGHILAQKYRCEIAGNIGISPFDFIDSNLDYLVLELSSYQLEYMFTPALECATILNITPDHIDHHGTMQNYIEAKARIVQLAHKTFVCKDGANLDSIFERFNNKITTFSIKDRSAPLFSDGKSIFLNGDHIADFTSNLIGMHNVQNVAAAFAMTLPAMAADEISSAIKTFTPLKHRIQLVSTLENIAFYNDSKATNAESTEIALASFDDKTEVYLIAGGRKKQDGIEVLLSNPVFAKVREVFLIGECAGDFASKIIEYNNSHGEKKVRYVLCGTLEKAASLAFTAAKKSQSDRKKVVLLSPLCASFDQFKNYEERGNAFIDTIHKLS